MDLQSVHISLEHVAPVSLFFSVTSSIRLVYISMEHITPVSILFSVTSSVRRLVYISLKHVSPVIISYFVVYFENRNFQVLLYLLPLSLLKRQLLIPICFFLDDQESACRDILGLVHHCPTVMDLELDKLVEECFKVNQTWII